MPATVDDHAWPLAVVRWSGRVTDGELTLVLSSIDRWLERGGFGLLLDARGASGLSQDHRRAVVKFIRENQERSARNMVQAVVHDNAIQRALYIAIRTVAPMPFPSASFADPDAALDWLRLEMAKRVTT